ncbi:urease accessory protein UreD [Metabacillus sediminilitoris]|uniref:Urease accessory protein UreD n=1 Tax=Metabacillus sediminilitoris TaxID=2567941 RepID=A0A4S4BYY9_9BACI|nr:urease accessory protein UreD [Metabacillus sediminilitoris]QGQ47130.1 urease accessory protein UreD [Metabacillus sediminilitoris]THF80475.1 urease accessory protein UreD [Metabacillus sediminilitoris]
MTYTGCLQLEVGKKENRSVIGNSFFDGVFKITRPTYFSDGMPLLTLLHVGGGYVDGDTYKSEVIVHEDAQLALTTQASTKVYKSPRYGVVQTMDYHLKENSVLFVKQDPLILYHDANFSQYTNVHMSSTSTFYYTDIITPGWSQNGRLFQYKKLASKLRIFINGQLEVFDHQLIVPEKMSGDLMRLEGYTHIGTMIMIHQQISDELIDDIRSEMSTIAIDVRFGISMLNVKGFSIKVLALSTPEIELIFSICEKMFRKRLYNQDKIEWRK